MFAHRSTLAGKPIAFLDVLNAQTIMRAVKDERNISS